MQDNDFLKMQANWGIILRADLETIQKIKRMIADTPGVSVIYQTTDIGRLRIVREDQARGGSNRD